MTHGAKRPFLHFVAEISRRFKLGYFARKRLPHAEMSGPKRNGVTELQNAATNVSYELFLGLAG